MRFPYAVAILALAAACRGKESSEQQAAPGTTHMVMRSDSLLPPMRAHLDSLTNVSAQSLAGMVPAHDAMASQLLDAMGSDMAMMGMRPDSAWTALADSVKRDLAELPVLPGEALERHWRTHVGRFRRLLQMHDGMMRSEP